jgi:hypothetical protein
LYGDAALLSAGRHHVSTPTPATDGTAKPFDCPKYPVQDGTEPSVGIVHTAWHCFGVAQDQTHGGWRFDDIPISVILVALQNQALTEPSMAVGFPLGMSTLQTFGSLS